MLIRDMNLRSLIMVMVTLLLAGCGNRPAMVLPYFKPYKMDIQQGNVVTQEMIAKVKPGMTRNQVRFALGTPLVVDPFRTDRWDYVYLYNKAGVLTEQRKIAVIFKDDRLVRIDGDVVAAAPGAATPAAKTDKPVAPAAAPPAQPEKQ
jgi:outer membrane protein assembly factor BamE